MEETFEQRSCLRKTRYEVQPMYDRKNMYSYACSFCGGWHLATKRERKSGDVTYTDEGWPVVPFVGSNQ